MKYDPSVQHELITRLKNGESPTALSKSSGISRSTIYRWKNEESTVSAKEKLYTKHDIAVLERKVKKLESIVQILKTVDCTIHSPLQDRLNALEKLHSDYDVHTLCDALNVARGTYYNHILRNKRDNVWYRKREEEYRILIHDIFYEFDQIFGAKKIHAILQQRGHRVKKEYVARIMRDLGLSSIRNQSKITYEFLNKKPKNIVQQQFNVSGPNLTWVSDVTCFKYNGHWLYICTIIDLYSRMVVGYHIGKRNSSQLLGAALRKACDLRTPAPGLVFHSDCGTQYRSHAFREKLEKYGMVQSLSRPGNPHDNAVIESFFSSMKREELYRREYTSEFAFREGVAKYIDFYNNKRPHSTMNYKTPVQVEQAYYAKRSVSRQGSD